MSAIRFRSGQPVSAIDNKAIETPRTILFRFIIMHPPEELRNY
jgi:hypothetical protein